MSATRVVVEILNVSLAKITEVKGLKPFNLNGDVLQYSKELSNYGQCKFRISTNDTIFTTYGDIFIPHKNHVRIRRGGTTIWQGAIVDNPKRNKDYIDVEAVEYEFYLDKILINRTSPDANGTADIFRIFKTGTMAQAVTTLVNETITKFASSNHILAGMTLGTVENPDYPPGLTSDYDSSALTGAWSFGDSTASAKGPQLQFDFMSLLYVLRVFGMYTYADFEIDENLQFNFKKFLGTNKKELVFSYGQQGNIIDYNLPRLGKRQINSAVAVATDPNGVILHTSQQNQDSIKTYGLIEEVAFYKDVIGKGNLESRIKIELPLVSTPDESNAMVYLNETGYPLGQYNVGDLITVKIKDASVDFNQIRRVVGYTVIQNETGREMIALQTNRPYDWQLGL